MEILKQHSILYAEDESIIRLNVSQQLSNYFKTVHVAKDGLEALNIYDEVHPDALMLDINMPKKDGLELVQHIRKTNTDVPIVMLTAYTDSNLLLEAIELNLCKYLVKPMSKSKLKEALQKVAEHLELNAKDIFRLSPSYYWHKTQKKLYEHKIPIPLPQREQLLLELLVKKHKQITSFIDIMAHVWEDKYDEEISIDSVKKLVSTLRKKLPENTLKSVYGEGYVLSV